MSTKSLRTINPDRMSAACRALNPQIFATNSAPATSTPETQEAAPTANQGTTAVRITRRGRMNKTETEMSRILQARMNRHEIAGFVFEGMTLFWGGTADATPMRYTPDFVVFENDEHFTFIEVKGGHIFDRDIVRFKGCRAEWSRFNFEMHQKKAGAWRKIL